MTDEIKQNELKQEDITMTDEMKKNEVTEEQLKDVAGGKIKLASSGLAYLDLGEKATFAFNIGDRVECAVCYFGTERGTIVDRRMKRDEIEDYYDFCVHDGEWPEYKVQFDKLSYREKYKDEWLRQGVLSY